MRPNLVVPLTTARRILEDLVDRAERGEMILITRRGRPAAFLVSAEAGRRLEASHSTSVPER
jgi:prevent-host-death family protein